MGVRCVTSSFSVGLSVLTAVRPALGFLASSRPPYRRTGMAAFASAAATDTKAPVLEHYGKLSQKLRDIDSLEGAMGLLGWDEQVMMPTGAAEARGKMKAALAGAVHEKRTHPALGEIVERLAKPEALNSLSTDFERANVRLAKRDWDLETRKTSDMASREAELEAKGYQVWTQARKDNDFPAFEPVLTEILALKTEIAKAVHPDLSVYDGNIDAFEKSMSAARLAVIFGELKEQLLPLFKRIQASPQFDKEVHPALKSGSQWDVESQVKLSKDLSNALGFDYEHGRIDTSVHPFTGGSGPTDVRITTRYSENWMEGVAGTVHEVGHGLYEQGRPSGDHRGLPVSRALSMGAHESQSLLWERMVFQGRPFWDFATPLFQKHFLHTSECTPQDFYEAVNRVRPGLIRVNADEVTYPLHIILRFELEQALFNGSVAIADLPTTWNKAMKDMLGVDVPSDAQGVLQDVHWSCGAIGYFPSYLLGSLTAAQLYAKAKKEIPGLESDVSAGRFSTLLTWLREKVHSQGSLHESVDELLVAATGEPLNISYFVEYLTQKYTVLYGL